MKRTCLFCLFVMTLLVLFMADGFCVIRAHAAQSAVTSVSLTDDAQSAAGETVLASPLCRTDSGQLLLSYTSGGGFFAGGALGACVFSLVKKKKKEG